MNTAEKASREALIVMDCQCAIIDGYVTDGAAFLDLAARTIAAARAVGVPVIYVIVAFRPGHPEIASDNRMFNPVRAGGLFLRDDAPFAIAPQIAPESGDIIVEKHRVSSFEGTDLAIILRSLGVDSLALCGVMTSGCVLSTVRQAADLDYRLTVIADLCADVDPEVHAMLLDKIFPAQCDVASASDWAESLVK